MRLIIPYTKFSSVQAQHLYMDGWDAEFVDVSSDPHLYFQIMKELWSAKEDFILLEHDIIPWPGALKTFEDCDRAWCAFEYFYPPSGHLLAANGCVRFRQELIEFIPNLFEIIELGGNDPKHWKTLDGRMNLILNDKLKDFVHVHKPPVVHLKDDIPGQLVPEELAD